MILAFCVSSSKIILQGFCPPHARDHAQETNEPIMEPKYPTAGPAGLKNVFMLSTVSIHVI